MELAPGLVELPIPRVSVLLVVRDCELYVSEAVESILAQTWSDFELLIYDDGSTDETPEILERAAGRDPRVQLFREEPRGLTHWLRRGVGDARGEYVARMDADDVAHPERLARQVAWLDEHPDCVAVGCDALLVDPERRPIRRLGVPADHDAIDAQLMRGRGDALLHPSVLLRRDAVLAVGGYRAEHRVSQCLDLFLRLAEHGRLANLPEPLLLYRQHLGKVSGTRKGEQRRTQDAILAQACKRRELPASALPVRPAVPERMTDADLWHRWASWAVDAGHLWTARRYAWRLLREESFSTRSCKLMLRAVTGLRLAPARRLHARLRSLLGSRAVSREFGPVPGAGSRSSGR